MAPDSLYSAMPTHMHARHCPAKTPWGPWPHLIWALSAHFPCNTPRFPIFGAFVACFLVYSLPLYLVFCAFSVVEPAEDCFAILCCPLFAALLSAAAIIFVAAGIVTRVCPPPPPAVPVWCSARSTTQQYLRRPLCCAVRAYAPHVTCSSSVLHLIFSMLCVISGTARHCISKNSTGRVGARWIPGGVKSLRAAARAVGLVSMYLAMPAHKHARCCLAQTP